MAFDRWAVVRGVSCPLIRLRSTTATSRPSRASRYAVVSPAMPAPMTQTSVSRPDSRGGNSGRGAPAVHNEGVERVVTPAAYRGARAEAVRHPTRGCPIFSRLMADTTTSPAAGASRLRQLTEELRELEARLREGGGAEKLQRQHDQGKLSARERIELLRDADTGFLEVGLLVAHDQYDGQAPSAGVVTGVVMVAGRPVVVVANDATVKAGSWWPETIRKILRAQEIAMRCRIPIIYLVDSAGVNLPYQGGVFPGQYGASRIFYYNSIMRRYLHVPQLAAVMGPCIAGGAYLPALSDVIVMVKGTSFMGLGGPNLVKGATGQTIDAETLGGALTHTEVSAVAHYAVDDDDAGLAKVRDLVKVLPESIVPPRADPRIGAPRNADAL